MSPRLRGWEGRTALQTRVYILALPPPSPPLTRCETSGTSLHPQPRFPHLWSGDANGTPLTRPGQGFGRMPVRELLAPAGVPCPDSPQPWPGRGQEAEPPLHAGSAFMCAESCDLGEDSWPLAGDQFSLWSLDWCCVRSDNPG